jgi:hypothetical protein
MKEFFLYLFVYIWHTQVVVKVVEVKVNIHPACLLDLGDLIVILILSRKSNLYCTVSVDLILVLLS